MEHDPGMCPTFQMVDANREWVQNRMRMNAGHPSGQGQVTYIDPITHEVRPVSFGVGITIDGYWVNTRNHMYYNWIFDTALYYDKVPKLLEYLGAPRDLVRSCCHWTQRPRDYKSLNVERKVQNYIQTNARTSLGYRPHFKQRASDGALKLVGISNLELSFVKNPRYVACEVLIANSAGHENKLGDTRPLLDTHTKIRRMTEPDAQTPVQEPETQPVDDVVMNTGEEPKDVAPPPPPPPQEATYGDLVNVLKVRNGLDVPDGLLEQEKSREFVLRVNQVLSDYHKKEQDRRTKIMNEGMPNVVEAMKKSMVPESESQKFEKILNDIVINSSDGPVDPLWVVVKAMSDHMCTDPTESTRKRKSDDVVHNESEPLEILTSRGAISATIPHPELLGDDDGGVLVNSARKRRKLATVIQRLSYMPKMQAESIKYLQSKGRVEKSN